MKLRPDDIVADYLQCVDGEWKRRGRFIVRDGELYATKDLPMEQLEAWEKQGISDYDGSALRPSDGPRFLLGLLMRGGTYGRVALVKGFLWELEEIAGNWSDERTDRAD